MPRRHLIAPLLLLAFALLPVRATAQDKPSNPSFGELIEVSEVLLDVLVTDAQGKVVLGLGPDDFRVEEADEPIALESVSFYSNRIEVPDGEADKVPHAALNEVPADRYFLVVFHDQTRLGAPAGRYVQQQFEALRASRRWVREEMLPGDWVAVASYDVKLKVHQDFTHDRSALEEALERAARGEEPTGDWASRQPGELADGQPSIFAHLPRARELRRRTGNVYDGLRLLAQATSDAPGRKNLLLFTIGFGQLDGISPISKPDPRYYPALERALNDHNVAVYPIDLTPAGFEHIHSLFLAELADDTGGRYFEKFVGFLEPLRRIADEANGYYLLSYRAEHPAGESGFREVSVRTVNPDFEVRARKGYGFGSAAED